MKTAQELHKIANELRIQVLKMVSNSQGGHVAGPLSSAEIFSTLYFSGAVNLDQDKIILSCGHYCPILYAALAKAGYFPEKELVNFMKIGSKLPGHPERGLTSGVIVSSGPLGQGVSVATGIALAIKMKNGYWSQVKTPKVFCILSDGEIQEGQVWEAFNFAVRRQLDNLIFILDRNKVQIENYISQIATYGEIAGRFEAFGLNVFEGDGNDIGTMLSMIEKAKKSAGYPSLIIANTVAGKGVSFMENKPEWHDKTPSSDELASALKELDER